MAATQHAFLRVFRHVRDLAFVFAGRTHVDQRLTALALRQRFVEKCANLLVESFLRHWIICLFIFRDFARHGTAFSFPFVAATIENFRLLVSEQPERPESVASPPVSLITIKNARRLWRDAVTTAKLREFFR